MVSFLATADLHLKESEAEDRLDVLRWLGNRASSESVDAFLIGGDLFNSSGDARALAPDVKEVFERTLPEDLPVVMVAGNHDENLSELGWSRPVTVLEKGERTVVEDGDRSLYVHGLPYNRGESFESVENVFELEGDGKHLLLSHASFLSPKHRHLLAKIEESDEDNKYVLHADDFRNSGFDQILLGHWHGFQPLMDSPPVHYVGSPVPNSRNEEGEKGYLLGRCQNERISLAREDVERPPGWYYENRTELVVPGYEEALLDRLRREIDPDPGCRLRLSLEGFTRRDRETFRRDVEALLEDQTGEDSSIDLRVELQTAEEMDAPMIDRIFEAMEQKDPAEVLSIEELVASAEPDRIVSTMRTLLDEEPESIKQRARQFFLESVVGVIES